MRADILVRDAQGRIVYVIDVAIVMHSAEEYLKRSVCAQELRQCWMKSRKKKDSLVHLPAIVPFALEFTGRLGPAAKDFVKEICGTNACRNSHFSAQCS